MKINVLIERLRELQANLGNVEVRVKDSEFGTRGLIGVKEATVIFNPNSDFVWETSFDLDLEEDLLEEDEEIRTVVLID